MNIYESIVQYILTALIGGGCIFVVRFYAFKFWNKRQIVKTLQKLPTLESEIIKGLVKYTTARVPFCRDYIPAIRHLEKLQFIVCLESKREFDGQVCRYKISEPIRKIIISNNHLKSIYCDKKND